MDDVYYTRSTELALNESPTDETSYHNFKQRKTGNERIETSYHDLERASRINRCLDRPYWYPNCGCSSLTWSRYSFYAVAPYYSYTNNMFYGNAHYPNSPYFMNVYNYNMAYGSYGYFGGSSGYGGQNSGAFPNSTIDYYGPRGALSGFANPSNRNTSAQVAKSSKVNSHIIEYGTVKKVPLNRLNESAVVQRNVGARNSGSTRAVRVDYSSPKTGRPTINSTPAGRSNSTINRSSTPTRSREINTSPSGTRSTPSGRATGGSNNQRPGARRN